MLFLLPGLAFGLGSLKMDGPYCQNGLTAYVPSFYGADPNNPVKWVHRAKEYHPTHIEYGPIPVWTITTEAKGYCWSPEPYAWPLEWYYLDECDIPLEPLTSDVSHCNHNDAGKYVPPAQQCGSQGGGQPRAAFEIQDQARLDLEAGAGLGLAMASSPQPLTPAQKREIVQQMGSTLSTEVHATAVAVWQALLAGECTAQDVVDWIANAAAPYAPPWL